MDDLISRQAAIDAWEKIHRVFCDLNLHCAYDRPGFFAHEGKEYVVIPDKYHKGYDQALEDAEKKIKVIMEELCYE